MVDSGDFLTTLDLNNDDKLNLPLTYQDLHLQLYAIKYLRLAALVGDLRLK